MKRYICPEKNGSASCSLKWIRKTVISAPHTSYLILSMPVPLRSYYSTFHSICFKINVFKPYSIVCLLADTPQKMSRSLPFLYSSVPNPCFSIHIFPLLCSPLFQGTPPHAFSFFPGFFSNYFGLHTPAVVLCVLLPLLVSSSLIFVLYLSHAQLNYNRSVSHLDSHKHKFQTQTHLSGFFFS